MKDIIYLSSDEEDDKIVDHTDVFNDEKPKHTGHRKQVSSDVRVDEEEDDCVVLDGDPYKTKEKESTISNSCATDDDILVLGQKGEIACRDFPHPRHACAKYPFNSTSHEKYCDMCYCYVCDIRAPCPHWCIGISTIDHCHANDRELIWKNQRECIRTGKPLPPKPMLQNTWYSHVNQFGPSTMVTSRPNTYIRPGYRPEQPRTTFPQNPGLQPHSYQNQNGRFNNGNPIPQVFSSKSPTWTQQRPSVGATQGVQYNRYVTQQINSQQTFGDYVTSSHANMYGRKCSGKTRFPQTSAVPFGTQYPPAKQQQQQQQARSNEKLLSEIEDWLMDSTTTPTDPVCPVPGQVNPSTFQFGLETFFR